MRFPPFLTLLLSPIALTQALKFELYAQPEAELTPRCIRNFVGADTLVVVTAIVGGERGQGQRVNIDVYPMDYTPSAFWYVRFVIPKAMITVVPGMLMGKSEWRLLPMVKLLLMSVSKISSLVVFISLKRELMNRSWDRYISHSGIGCWYREFCFWLRCPSKSWGIQSSFVDIPF